MTSTSPFNQRSRGPMVGGMVGECVVE